MTKQTLPILLTATILIAGIFAMGMTFDDADAAKPNPKVKPFNCSSSGTFSSDGATSETEGAGNCTHLGKTTSTGTFDVTGFVGTCLTIESTNSVLTAANGDQVNLDVTGTQCFFDENGDPTAPANWCQVGGAHTSTVDGEYDVTGGDGRFTDAQGSGDLDSDANHCDDPPNTDTFESTISGTIEYAASNKS